MNNLRARIDALYNNAEGHVDQCCRNIDQAVEMNDFMLAGVYHAFKDIHKRYAGTLKFILEEHNKQEQQPHQQQPQPAATEQPADAGGNDIKPTPEYIEARRFANLLESMEISASNEYLGGIFVTVAFYIESGRRIETCRVKIGPQDKVSIADAVLSAVSAAIYGIGKPEKR